MSLSDEQLVEILGGDIPAKTFERLREAIEQNERPDLPKTGALCLSVKNKGL